MFLPDTENISVEMLVLYSVALISKIGLLKAEALTGKPNEKEPTFNEEPSPDNDEVKTILIGHFCVFEEKWSTAGAFLERDANIRGYHLIIRHLKSFKNIQVTHLIFGGSVTTFPKMKPSIDLKNNIHKLTSQTKSNKLYMIHLA